MADGDETSLTPWGWLPDKFAVFGGAATVFHTVTVASAGNPVSFLGMKFYDSGLNGNWLLTGGTLAATNGAAQIEIDRDTTVTVRNTIIGSDAAFTRNVTVSGGKFSYDSTKNFAGTLTFTSGTLGGTNLRGMGTLSFGDANHILAPGNSIGTLTMDGAKFTSGGVFELEIGGVGLNDKLIVDTLTLSHSASAALNRFPHGCCAACHTCFNGATNSSPYRRAAPPRRAAASLRFNNLIAHLRPYPRTAQNSPKMRPLCSHPAR